MFDIVEGVARMEREKVAERVRKLLAVAVHPNTGDEEAQAYAAAAAGLMARYELDEAVIRSAHGQGAEPIEQYDHMVPGTGGHGKARASALYSIAAAYGCPVATRGNDARTWERHLVIVGTVSALHTLRILLTAIALQMEGAAAKAARAHVKRLSGWHTPAERARERRVFFRSFVRAYGLAVADKIRAQRQEMADEVAGTGAALVLARDEGRVRAEFGRRFPRLGRERRERSFSRAGHLSGYEQGRRADLGGGNVEGGGRPAITARSG